MCWVQGGMIQTLMLALEEHAPFGMRNRWVTNHSPQWQELQYVHTVLKRKKMGQLPSREWGWGNIREGFLEMVKSESWRINLQERLIHALKSILLKTNKTKSCDRSSDPDGIYIINSPILEHMDLNWIPPLAFLVLWSADSRLWDFSGYIIMWAKCYNKSPGIYVSISLSNLSISLLQFLWRILINTILPIEFWILLGDFVGGSKKHRLF